MGRTFTYRSLLFVPAVNARAMEKAPSLPADYFLLDLEDSVSAVEKPKARDAVWSAISQGHFGSQNFMVRVNDLGSAFVADDLRALQSVNVPAILFPKVNSLADVLQAEALLDVLQGFEATEIWVMLETAQGILNAPQIMAHARVAGCLVGPNDLEIDLRAAKSADRTALQTSLQMVVLSARAAGKVCIDGVYNRFDDEVGFAAECLQGRNLGFDGKSLIHPSQIAGANRVFGATDMEIARARQIIEAYEASDSSVVSLNGEMIEELHVKDAQALLDQIAKQMND